VCRGTIKSCGCQQFKKGKDHHLWLGKNKQSQRERELKYLYGISLEQYNKMLKLQKNVCVICGNKEVRRNSKGNIRILSVDHNHEIGRVRGLLCGSCNQALGLVKESIKTLTSMIKYILIYK